MPRFLLFTLITFFTILSYAQSPQFWDDPKNKKTNTDSYQEMNYDDLLQEYQSVRKSRMEADLQSTAVKKTSSIFTSYVMSFGQYQVGDESVSLSHQGFSASYAKEFLPQISWGVQYKNFPTAAGQNLKIGANEVNGAVIYSSILERQISMQLSTGLATRILNVQRLDGSSNTFSAQFLLGTAIMYQPVPEWVVGFEPQAKSAFLTRSADRTAFDFNFKLGAKF